MQTTNRNLNLREMFPKGFGSTITPDAIPDSQICTIFHSAFNLENSFFEGNSSFYTLLIKKIYKLGSENIIPLDLIINTMKLGCEIHPMLDNHQKYQNFKYISDCMKNEKILVAFKKFLSSNVFYVSTIINDLATIHPLFKNNSHENALIYKCFSNEFDHVSEEISNEENFADILSDDGGFAEISDEENFDKTSIIVKINHSELSAQEFDKTLKFLNRISTFAMCKIIFDVQFSEAQLAKGIENLVAKSNHIFQKIDIAANNKIDNANRLNVLIPLISDLESGLKLLLPNLEISFIKENFKEIAKIISTKVNLNPDIICTAMVVILMENKFNVILEDLEFFEKNKCLKNMISQVHSEWKRRLLSHPFLIKINSAELNYAKFSDTSVLLTNEIKNIEKTKTVDSKYEFGEQVLFNMLDNINFYNKNAPAYIDPLRLGDDGNLLLKKFAGSPSHIFNAELKKLILDFKSNLRKLLMHSLNVNVSADWRNDFICKFNKFVSLSKTSANAMATSCGLIEISLSGYHCPSRWIPAIEDSIKSFDEYFKIDGLSTDQIVCTFFEQYKQGFLSEITLKYGKILDPVYEPHILNSAARIMNKHCPIPKNMGIDLYDNYFEINYKEFVTDFYPLIEEEISHYLSPINTAKFIQTKIHETLQSDPSMAPYFLNVCNEYAKKQLHAKILEIESPSFSERIEKGKQVASSALKKWQILQAILSEDQQAIATFRKTDLMLFRMINQKEMTMQESLKKIPDEDVTENHEFMYNDDLPAKAADRGVKRKAEFGVEESQSDVEVYRASKRQKIDHKIKRYMEYSESPDLFENGLSRLGSENFHSSINLKIENLISDYLSEEQITSVDLEGNVKITLYGAFILLFQLEYLKKFDIKNGSEFISLRKPLFEFVG